jgi:hypothetical protein
MSCAQSKFEFETQGERPRGWEHIAPAPVSYGNTRLEAIMAVLTQPSHFPVTRSELPWAVRTGVIGGIVAGVMFAAYEMIVTAAMMGIDSFFMPLRMIGAILLGPVALDPTYPVLSASLAALAVHVPLAIAYGVIFAVIVGGLRSAATDIALGALYGAALWLINFYVVAPTAFPWFLMSSPLVQFIGHTFFFGAVLGWFVWTSRHSAESAAA